MLIRVEQGKGGRDRNAMLSPQFLDLLRIWWREGKRRGVMFPHGWLFPGRSYTDPDGLVSHVDAALGEQLLDIAQAERETVVEPDRLTDDLRRKTVSLDR